VNREQLKHIAAIATAVGAVVASVVALLREHPEPKAEKSYDVLAEKVVELQEASRKHHEDVVAMRSYLEGYLKSLRDSQEKLGAVQSAMTFTRRAPTVQVRPPPSPALPAPASGPSLTPPEDPF
jgi:hypothetical protein